MFLVLIPLFGQPKEKMVCLIEVFVPSDLCQCNTLKSTYCSVMHIKYSTSAQKTKPHKNLCINNEKGENG